MLMKSTSSKQWWLLQWEHIPTRAQLSKHLLWFALYILTMLHVVALSLLYWTVEIITYIQLLKPDHSSVFLSHEIYVKHHTLSVLSNVKSLDRYPRWCEVTQLWISVGLCQFILAESGSETWYLLETILGGDEGTHWQGQEMRYRSLNKQLWCTFS